MRLFTNKINKPKLDKPNPKLFYLSLVGFATSFWLIALPHPLHAQTAIAIPCTTSAGAVTCTAAANGNFTHLSTTTTGSIEITIGAGATVTGTSNRPIYATTGSSAAGKMKITVGAGATITATGTGNNKYNGIQFEHDGASGNAEVILNGEITGDIEDGINVVIDSSRTTTRIDPGGEGAVVTVIEEGDVVIETGTNSVISARDNGIYAENFGGGNIRITHRGSITTSTREGIAIDDRGTGTAEITNEGTITSTSNDGINIQRGRDTGLTVTNNGIINSKLNGILAQSGAFMTVRTGAGSSTTAISSILAEGDDRRIHAISLTSYATRDDDAHIRLTHNGKAEVLGSTAATIFVEMSSSRATGDIIIETGANSETFAKQGDNGIFVNNEGSGNIQITHRGNLISRGSPIYVRASEAQKSAAIRIEGNITRALGSVTENTLTITNEGTITATRGKGIYFFNLTRSAGRIVITNNGHISSGRDGADETEKSNFHAIHIGVQADMRIVTSEDSVITSEGGGVILHSEFDDNSIEVIHKGEITALLDGINVINEGEGGVEITSEKVITSTRGKGISSVNILPHGFSVATGRVIITNNGNISAATYAIHVVNEGDIDVTIAANSIIQSAGEGVILQTDFDDSSVEVIHKGEITAVGDGINVINEGTGGVEITNEKAITSTGGKGISSLIGSSVGRIVVRSSGNISAGTYAIHLMNMGDIDVTIGENSIVRSAGEGVILQGNFDDNSIEVTHKGEITAAGDGINVINEGTGGVEITNEKSITSTRGKGISSLIGSSVGRIVVRSSGNISAGTYAIHLMNMGDIDVTIGENSIIRSAGEGVILQGNFDDNSIEVTHKGEITAAGDGINVINDGAGGVEITNEKSITSTRGKGISSVSASSSGRVIIRNNGNINAGTYAIHVVNQGHIDVTISENSIVRSAGEGVILQTDSDSRDLSVTHKGQIFATGDGIGITNEMAQAGVAILIEGTVNSIQGSGVYAKIASGSTARSATIAKGATVRTDSISLDEWAVSLESPDDDWIFQTAGTIYGKMRIQGSYEALECATLILSFQEDGASVLVSEVTGELTGETVVYIGDDDFIPTLIVGRVFLKVNKGKSATERFIIGGDNIIIYEGRPRLVRGLVMYDIGFDDGPAGLPDTDTSLAGSHFIISALGLENHFLKTIPHLVENVWFDGMEQWSRRILSRKERGESRWVYLSGSSSSRDVEANIKYDDDSKEELELDYEQDIASLRGGFDFIYSEKVFYGFLMGIDNSDTTYNIYQTNKEVEYQGVTMGAYASYITDKVFINFLSKVDFGSVEGARDLADEGDFQDAESLSYGIQLDVGGSIENMPQFSDKTTIDIFIGVNWNITDVKKVSNSYEGKPNIDMTGNENGLAYVGARFGSSYKTQNNYTLSYRFSAQFGASIASKNDVELILAGSYRHILSNDEPIYGDTYGDVSIDFDLKRPEIGVLYYFGLKSKFFDGTRKLDINFGMRFLF